MRNFLRLLPIIFTFLSINGIKALSGNIPLISGATPTRESIFENPSLVCDLKSNIIYLSYLPSRYGISELNSSTFGAAYNIDSTFSAASLIRGSYSDIYSNLLLEQSIGGKITESFSLALSLCVENRYIKNYDTKRALFANVSAQYKIFDSAIIGLKFSNINRSKIGGDDIFIEQNFSCSLGYLPYDFLSLELDGIFRLDAPSSAIIGINCQIASSVNIYLAYEAFPRNLDFGVSYAVNKKINLYLTTNYLEPLGFTNSLALAFSF